MSREQSQHEIVCQLQSLAVELGRAPTRDDAVAAGLSKRAIDAAFGSFSAALQAAGLEPRQRRITNAVFERDIQTYLAAQPPRPSLSKKVKLPKIAIISDIHWPFHAPHVVEAFLKFIAKHQPEHVALNGDAWDMYSHGKFPRSHNVFTPREEQALARKLNEEFWRDVRKAAPDAKCYQLLGNHDLRPLKRVLDQYPEAEDWIAEKMRSMFSFEGVETIHDDRQELIVSDIVIHHGFKMKLGDHRDHNLMNSISGHTHRPGVVYRTVRGEAIWELNCGYAGDPQAKGLTYTPTRIVSWVQSWGWVDEYGPRVVMP